MRPDYVSYIKIGDLRGECVDPKHTGWIAVTSWNYTTERRPSDGQRIDVFTFEHVMEHCSPALMSWCAEATAIPSVVLSCCLAGKGSHPVKRLVMDDCRVAAFTASGGSLGVLCTVRLVYAKLTVDMKGRRVDGANVINLFDARHRNR